VIRLSTERLWLHSLSLLAAARPPARLVTPACSFDNPDTFFDLLDLDHSGSVSVKELMALFTALVPKGTDQAIIKSIVDDIMVAAGDSSGAWARRPCAPRRSGARAWHLVHGVRAVLSKPHQAGAWLRARLCQAEGCLRAAYMLDSERAK